jgi:atypical dual specificity phosphatase
VAELTSDIDLSFVFDDTLRHLVESYYRQAVTCYEAKAYLGTVVICGGVVEGLLAWALLAQRREQLPKPQTDKPIEEWDISRLIKVAQEVGLLGDTAKDAAWAVKGYRNLIHPYNLIRSRKSARADQSLAASALTAMKEITRSLRGRLRNVATEETAAGGDAVRRKSTPDARWSRQVLNFAWLEEGKIAGCRGPRSGEDLTALHSLGIRALVRLADIDESAVTPSQVREAGLEDCPEPIRDCTAPTQQQIDQVVAFIASALDEGKPVAVSCGAGYGRTGTLLACYLVRQGASADDAMKTVRDRAERGPETDEQEAAIRRFEGKLKRDGM